ncbi:MAG TPA: hypothetical protein VLE43_17255, partial [Candidatus Saccharimonadia bacterium]|nr:hypothetical protein [Candidatus Saccharimonadia bacterium]
MNWPHFHFGQEDLAARSVQPFYVEREYYPLNHMYGSADVIRKYAGIPEGRPLPWSGQHIPSFVLPSEADAINPAVERRLLRLAGAKMPFTFTINGTHANLLRKGGYPPSFETGLHFHYARELYSRRNFESQGPRRGTIALPDTGVGGLQFDRGLYAKKLLALPEEYQPVYVSIYWRDIEQGHHEAYLQAGLPVVCSGSQAGDPLFGERFYDICSQFKYACSNEISTSFLLSVMSGCEFFFLDGGTVIIPASSRREAYAGEHPSFSRPGERACIDAAPFPPTPETTARQRDLASFFTGESFMRPPEFFREMWELGRKALSDDLVAQDLEMSSVPAPADFARWLPFGIDGDGWADQVCGITVPARDGFT